MEEGSKIFGSKMLKGGIGRVFGRKRGSSGLQEKGKAMPGIQKKKN